MNALRHLVADEGHSPAAAIFVGILCAIAVLLVAGIVIGALGRAA
jgi:hypothetical protein